MPCLMRFAATCRAASQRAHLPMTPAPPRQTFRPGALRQSQLSIHIRAQCHAHPQVYDFTSRGNVLFRSTPPSDIGYNTQRGRAWQRKADCRRYPHLDWIEPASADAVECRSICRMCSVRTECLESALLSQEPWGIWGGLDPAERLALAHTRGGPSPRTLPPHGTNPRYAKHGCRCDACRAAHSDYERRRRRRRRRLTHGRNERV